MDYFLIILLVIAMTIAVIEDLRRQKIPNLVTFPTMVSGACLSFSYHAAWMVFCSAPAAWPWDLDFSSFPMLMGAWGPGTSNSWAPLGAIVGAKGIIIASILVILAGGVYGLILFVLNPRYTAALFKRLWTTLKTFVLTRQFILIPPGDDRRCRSCATQSLSP